MRQVGATGLEGWTEAVGKHSRGEWMNSTLVVRAKNGETKKFRAGYAFIEAWGFMENDRFVVVRSRNAHGPARWEKFDFQSGKLVEEFFRSKDSKIPDWVKPFQGSD